MLIALTAAIHHRLKSVIDIQANLAMALLGVRSARSKDMSPLRPHVLNSSSTGQGLNRFAAQLAAAAFLTVAGLQTACSRAGVPAMGVTAAASAHRVRRISGALDLSGSTFACAPAALPTKDEIATAVELISNGGRLALNTFSTGVIYEGVLEIDPAPPTSGEEETVLSKEKQEEEDAERIGRNATSINAFMDGANTAIASKSTGGSSNVYLGLSRALLQGCSSTFTNTDVTVILMSDLADNQGEAVHLPKGCNPTVILVVPAASAACMGRPMAPGGKWLKATGDVVDLLRKALAPAPVLVVPRFADALNIISNGSTSDVRP